MYYLADGDTYLCCKSQELAEHLVKNGCHYVIKEEFEVGERRERQRIWLKFEVYRQHTRLIFALRELQARLLAGA